MKNLEYEVHTEDGPQMVVSYGTRRQLARDLATLVATKRVWFVRVERRSRPR